MNTVFLRLDEFFILPGCRSVYDEIGRNRLMSQSFLYACKKGLCILFALCLLGAVMMIPGVSAASDRPLIVVTTFPIYDWVHQIAGDSVDLIMLLDSGVDLHSYQPTAQDILRIAQCDLFIYIGGESDKWVADALNASPNDSRRVLNLMEALGQRALAEETVEGMENEENGTEGEEEDEEEEKDEHIWLSLRNARMLTEAISNQLASLNPDQAALYTENETAYQVALDQLDSEYTAMISGAPFRSLLFGDRFPFRYLTEDYGLEYYAAFSGCSAETEASFNTIAFLAGKLSELHLPAVLTIEGTNHRIAETIVQASGGKDLTILTLNSLQSATSRDIDNGTDYLSVMKQNLEVLRQALYGTDKE